MFFIFLTLNEILAPINPNIKAGCWPKISKKIPHSESLLYIALEIGRSSIVKIESRIIIAPKYIFHLFFQLFLPYKQSPVY